MFTYIVQKHYQGEKEREHIWKAMDVEGDAFLVGAVLSQEVIRIRFLRGPSVEAARYQLADGGAGTLPYHSWAVVRGDEEWVDTSQQTEDRAVLESYLSGFCASPTHLRLTRPLLVDERIYGLGERTGKIDKRGQAFPIWNVDPHKGHDERTETMYTSIPCYLGLTSGGRAYGMLLDHMGRVEMDIGRSRSDELSMTIAGDSMVVYFFAGPTPADVLRQYTALAGHMPLPPRWAIGYHQSRWGYDSEQRVRSIAKQLRARHHPCDAIWLDIDYMQGYRDFTWNEENFPYPAKLVQDLHARGMRMVTIIDPGAKIDEHYVVYQQGMEHDYFCRYKNGELFNGNVWPGACVFPDFSRGQARSWWANMHQALLNPGVDGLWTDMNEPALTSFPAVAAHSEDEKGTESNTMPDDVLHRGGGDAPTGPDGPPLLHKDFHNAYGMEMARASYEAWLQQHPYSRPFVLSRAGCAGIQRYAATWTGDNMSRWQDILLAIPMCLNLSMSGVAFVGVDIGGFWDASDGELLARFAQLGALLPFCRNHNSIMSPDQEPWVYGERYENAYRAAIETRYRLLPYLYTLFQEASSNGTPVMRPLYFHYPQDSQACDVEDAFLVGEHILSAPIYAPGATSRAVYLPAGTWFDYWTGQPYIGGGRNEIAAPLERWPLLVSSNSILPSGPLMQFTDQRATDPLTFTCYMDTDGQASYTLYDDDGATFAYKKGAFARTSISCRVDQGEAIVEIEEQFERYQPRRKEYEIIVHAGGKIRNERVSAGQGRVELHLSL